MIGTNAATVSPHDTNYLPKKGYIYVGTAGNVNILPEGKTNSDTPSDGVVFANCPAGFIIPVRVKKVFAGSGGTATTATNLVCIQEM
jgi:hypothetical protein